MKFKVVPPLILSTLFACLPVAATQRSQSPGRRKTARAPAPRHVLDDPSQKYGSVWKSFTPLMKAAALSDLRAVRTLVRKGANVNEVHYTGLSALMVAVERGHLPVVRELLGAGAEPDHKTTTPHAGQISALTWAITSDNADKVEMVETLIAAGADVNPKIGGGITPLMFASMPGGDVRVIELLVAKGADVNGTNPQNGYTALMGAAEESRGEIVTALIKAGADLHAKNKWGETALSIAVKSGRKDNERLLRLAGAKH
jgi:ankyrin repeat protein